LRHATESIIQTRDGLLRAAVPDPIGSCSFVNDMTATELAQILDVHRDVCQRYPREGDGEDMFTSFEAADELVD
jgi:hypothetical protein